MAFSPGFLLGKPGGRVSAELWRELGETMRRHRVLGRRSLRDLERDGGWRRGTLSQVENGKARPSRDLVDWYDRTFEGDGLLVSMYAEARAAHPAVGPVESPDDRECLIAGDRACVLEAAPPTGSRVLPGSQIDVRWSVRNSGAAQWSGRSLRRTGAPAGTRLLGGAHRVAVPDTSPGEVADVTATLTAPDAIGSVVAYWRMVDSSGRYCQPASDVFSVLLVVRP